MCAVGLDPCRPREIGGGRWWWAGKVGWGRFGAGRGQARSREQPGGCGLWFSAAIFETIFQATLPSSSPQICTSKTTGLGPTRSTGSQKSYQRVSLKVFCLPHTELGEFALASPAGPFVHRRSSSCHSQGEFTQAAGLLAHGRSSWGSKGKFTQVEKQRGRSRSCCWGNFAPAGAVGPQAPSWLCNLGSRGRGHADANCFSSQRSNWSAYTCTYLPQIDGGAHGSGHIMPQGQYASPTINSDP